MIPRSIITPAQAAERALALVGHLVYGLGPTHGEVGDCVRLAWEEAYGMPRKIPGLNRGLFAALLAAGFPRDQAEALDRVLDVEDDVNVNALIADALSAQRYVEIVTTPFTGALLCAPTIHDPRVRDPIVGHIEIVVGLSRSAEFDVDAPDYSLLDTVGLCGPNGRRPGVLRHNGAYFAKHAKDWPLPQHTTRMLRVLP